MNLRNTNMGDDIAHNVDKIGELTLYVPWWNIKKY